MTTIAQAAPHAVARPRWTRSDFQIGLLFVASVVTSIAVLAVSLLFPAAGDNGWFTYESVQAIGPAIWSFLTLTGANLVLTVVPATIVSVLLVPARGWPFATAGAVLAVIGVAFYAVAAGGWAMVYYFGAASPALDAATATAFIDSVNADSFRLFAPAYGGALLIAAATLLISVGLWRARTVPRWLPVLGVVGAILPLVLPTDGVRGVFVEAPQAAATALAGWFLWRRPSIN